MVTPREKQMGSQWDGWVVVVGKESFPLPVHLAKIAFDFDQGAFTDLIDTDYLKAKAAEESLYYTEPNED